MDTIFAQATAVGRAGVCVVRLSGPKAHKIADQLTGPLPAARQAVLRRIVDGSGAQIDQGLVLIFDGPDSFTGEDVVEFHLHGSVAVVKAVLATLSGFADTRLAEAGEFTRRALENNKLDLTQVEGLADLIDSETEAQRKQALKVLSREFGVQVEEWRSQLIRAAALLEATIDFVDEDVPVDVTPEVGDLLANVKVDLQREITGTKIAERVREGFEVAIVGLPNSGKSTLLNALAGREAAITSATAGTTRDVIEVQMDLGGIPVVLLDTAGLRKTDDEVESLGVSRAVSRATDADLRVFLAESGDILPIQPTGADIVVHPKADLRADGGFAVSGKTGAGVSVLVQRIQDILIDRVAIAGLATHERHRMAMQLALDHLDKTKEVLELGAEHSDLAAAELRFAIRALEVLVGRIDVENLLDEIFSSFCVGK